MKSKMKHFYLCTCINGKLFETVKKSAVLSFKLFWRPTIMLIISNNLFAKISHKILPTKCNWLKCALVLIDCNLPPRSTFIRQHKSVNKGYLKILPLRCWTLDWTFGYERKVPMNDSCLENLRCLCCNV